MVARGGCGDIVYWMMNGLDTGTWCLGKVPCLCKNRPTMHVNRANCSCFLKTFTGSVPCTTLIREAYSEQREWLSVFCTCAPQRGEFYAVYAVAVCGLIDTRPLGQVSMVNHWTMYAFPAWRVHFLLASQPCLCMFHVLPVYYMWGYPCALGTEPACLIWHCQECNGHKTSFVFLW